VALKTPVRVKRQTFTAGTTKTMIMNRAIEEYERNISASSALSTMEEEKAKIERVRGALAQGAAA
jgi:hypothetical protein